MTERLNLLTLLHLSLKVLTCVHAKSLQSYPTLCDTMECSPPGSSVLRVLQARILEWVSIPFSMGSSQPRDQAHMFCSSCIAGTFLTTEPPGEAQKY